MAASLKIEELQLKGYSVTESGGAFFPTWSPGKKYNLQLTVAHTTPNALIWFSNVDIRIQAAVDLRFDPALVAVASPNLYQTLIPLIRNGETQAISLTVTYAGTTPRAVTTKEFDIGIYANRYVPKQAWKKFGIV